MYPITGFSMDIVEAGEAVSWGPQGNVEELRGM